MNHGIEKRIKNIRVQLSRYLSRENTEGLENLFEITHPADLALAFESFSSERASELFSHLPPDLRVEVLSLVSPVFAASVIRNIEDRSFANYLPDMPPDDAADVYMTLSAEEKEQLLGRLDDQDFRRELVDLVSYPPDTAGGVMTTGFLAVEEDRTVDEALREVRDAPDKAEMVYYIYSIDEDRRLSGVVSLRRLQSTENHRRIREIVNRDLFKARVDVPREEVLELMDRYSLLSLPVVDYQERLQGVVTADDAVKIMEEEAAQSQLLRSGLWPGDGSHQVESALSKTLNFWADFGVRLPWLVMTCVGGLLAAVALGFFDDPGLLWSDYLYFLPLALALGGGAASQRAIQTGRPRPVRDGPPVNFWKNFFTGIFSTGLGVGLLLALLTGSVAWCWRVYALGALPTGETLIFSTVVGTAVLGVVILGDLVGFIVPRLLDKLSLDPAYIPNPLLAALVDFGGILVYFGIVSLLVDWFQAF